MAVETRQVARLIKRNKNNKIRKAVSIFQNDLGWVKVRTDAGKDSWIDTLDELTSKIDRWLLQGYVFEGEYELPTEVINRNTTNDYDDIYPQDLH